MPGFRSGAMFGHRGVEERSVQGQTRGMPARLARRPLGNELEEYHRQPVGQIEYRHRTRDWPRAMRRVRGDKMLPAGRGPERMHLAGLMREQGVGGTQVEISQSDVPPGRVGIDLWGAILHQLRQHARGLESLDNLRASGEDLSPVIRRQVRNRRGEVRRHGALRLSRSAPCPFALDPRKV